MQLYPKHLAGGFLIASLAFFISTAHAGVAYESIKLKSGEVLVNPEFIRGSKSGAVLYFAKPESIRTVPWAELPDDLQEKFRKCWDAEMAAEDKTRKRWAEEDRQRAAQDAKVAAKIKSDAAAAAALAEYNAALKLCRASRVEWADPSKPAEGRSWILTMEMGDGSGVILSFRHYYKPYESLYYVRLKGNEVGDFAPFLEKFFEWDKQAVETNIQTMQRAMGVWHGRNLVFQRENGCSSISGDDIWLDVESATRLCNMCAKHIKDIQSELEKKLDDIKRSALDFR